MNDLNEARLMLTYLRARATLARRDESGVSAVEWAIIVSLGVLIAFAVFYILMKKARDTANDVKTK